MDSSQQAAQAASSGQISSMQQHAAGGDASEDYPALDLALGGGLGKYQGFSLGNIGIGKLLTSGQLEAGLNVPAAQTFGIIVFKGVEMDFDMGQGDEEGQAPDAAQPPYDDQQQMHDQEAAAQQQQAQDPNQPQYQDAPHGFGPDHPENMPHGYGPDSQANTPHGYGPDQNQSQAMGMGGDTGGYGPAGGGSQEQPFGYGNQGNDKGMFESFRDDKGPFQVNPFAASGSAAAGAWDVQQDQQFSHAGYDINNNFESFGVKSKNKGGSDGDGDGDGAYDDDGAYDNGIEGSDSYGDNGDSSNYIESSDSHSDNGDSGDNDSNSQERDSEFFNTHDALIGAVDDEDRSKLSALSPTLPFRENGERRGMVAAR